MRGSGSGFLNQGCGHLKAWLRLGDPFLSSIMRLLARDLSSSPLGPLQRAVRWYDSWLSQSEWSERERERERNTNLDGSWNAFLLPNLGSENYHFCWSHWPALVHCERWPLKDVTTRRWDHQGPPWRLVTVPALSFAFIYSVFPASLGTVEDQKLVSFTVVASLLHSKCFFVEMLILSSQ